MAKKESKRIRGLREQVLHETNAEKVRIAGGEPLPKSSGKLRRLIAGAQVNIASQLTGSEKLSDDWGFINQGRGGVELRSGPRTRYGKSISLKDMIKILSLPRGESVVDDLSLITRALRGRAGDPSGLVLYHMGELVEKNISGGKKILVENAYKGSGRGLRLTPVWEELVTELQKGLDKLNVAVHPVTGQPIKISQVVPKHGIGAVEVKELPFKKIIPLADEGGALIKSGTRTTIAKGAIKEIPLYEFLGLTHQYENTKANLELLMEPEASHLPDKHPNGKPLTAVEKQVQKAEFAKNTKFHYETIDPETKRLRPRTDYLRDLSKHRKESNFLRAGTQVGKFAGIEEAERIAAKATKQVRLPAGIEKLGLLESIDEYSKYTKEGPGVLTEGKGKAKRITGVRGADNPIVTSATPESQLTGEAGGGKKVITLADEGGTLIRKGEGIVGVTRPAGTVSAAVDVDFPGPTSKQLDSLKRLGVVNTDVILTRREATQLISQLKEAEFEAARTGQYRLKDPGRKRIMPHQWRRDEILSSSGHTSNIASSPFGQRVAQENIYGNIGEKSRTRTTPEFQVRETPITGKVDAKGKITLSRLVRNRVVLDLEKMGLNEKGAKIKFGEKLLGVKEVLRQYGAQYNRKTKLWTIGNAMLKDYPAFWNLFGPITGKLKERVVEMGEVDRIVGGADPVPKQVQEIHRGVSRVSSLSEAKGAVTSVDDPYSWRMLEKDPRLHGTTAEVSTGERLGTSKPTTVRIHPANVPPETPIVEETVSAPKQKILAKEGRINNISGWFRNKLQPSVSQEDKGLSQIERMAAEARERRRYFKALAEKRATPRVGIKGLFQSEKLFDDALAKVRGKSLKMLLPALLLAGVFGTIMGNERNAA